MPETIGYSAQTLKTEVEPAKPSGILSIFDRENTIAPPVGTLYEMHGMLKYIHSDQCLCHSRENMLI